MQAVSILSEVQAVVAAAGEPAGTLVAVSTHEAVSAADRQGPPSGRRQRRGIDTC
ncbi:hypothetical protein ABT297_29690 [Dactylosporangium sp. NPDC000555]|uniref:hypothetical protein n=1 Tax=Dactylosporangium sp. NPDC000555 TaxID=3154260 RepID=UPI0033267B7E